MGTATLFEATRKTIDGKKLAFTAWCDLAEKHYSPEDGIATIEVRQADAPAVHPGWKLSVCIEDCKDLWLERWVEAFCTQPAYREQFACDAAGNGGVLIPREVTHPKTGEVKTQSTLPAIPIMPAFEAAQKKSHAVESFLRLRENARFRDFAALKSGRDAFSSLKLDALKEMMGSTRSAELMAVEADDDSRLKAARWAMRGLSVEDAFHKVKVDLEVAENAHGNKHAQSKGLKPQ
jgi:hypothetical protein